MRSRGSLQDTTSDTCINATPKFGTRFWSNFTMNKDHMTFIDIISISIVKEIVGKSFSNFFSGISSSTNVPGVPSFFGPLAESQ